MRATSSAYPRLLASAFSLVLALPAAAQVAPSPTPTPAPASAPGDAGAAADEIGEITVTARRREERLLTTPVSATVLSGDNLAQQNVDRKSVV